MTRLLRRLATTTTRRPRFAIIALLVLVVAAVGVGTSAGGDYVDDFSVPGIESQKAQDLIGDRFAGQGGDAATVVFSARRGGALKDGAAADGLREAVARIKRQPHVAAVDDPLSAGHLSPDGRTAFATVTYDQTSTELGADPRDRLEKATAPLGRTGVAVALSGQVVNAGDEPAAPVGEIAGVAVALLLLLIMLRSARATGACLLTALLGLGLGFALLGLAAADIDIPSLAPTIAAMLGIGAGIDYALLTAARHQEELRRGREPAAAAIRTSETAGHAAVTAAFIVLVSISGLLVTGIPFVGKVGVAAGVMVLVTALVGALLLPPFFTAIGRRMLPRREREVTGEATEPLASPGWVVRHPKVALVLGSVVALALVVPAAGLSIGQPDDGNLAPSKTQRQAYDRLAAAFGPGFNGPLVVVVDGERGGAVRDDAAKLRTAIAATPDVASTSPVTLDRRGETALITVFPKSAPQDDATSDLVHRLRDTTIPEALRATGSGALVGGYTARLVDEAQKISGRLPAFALVVVGLSLLLLALTFRSLKVAVLSAVLNLVSIAAAYGIIHLLFQTDVGTGLIGVEQQPVVAYTPLFMFAILFGLSTDYNVFLLSRVHEEWQRLGHVPAAVAEASARTRRTIATAGTIMIVVFLGFATDPDSTVKMTGFGLASAILVDVTLVRLVLAPAALSLLGDRLWRPRAATEAARAGMPSR